VTHNLTKIKNLVVDKNPDVGNFIIEITKHDEVFVVKFKTLYWGDWDDEDISKIASEFKYMGLGDVASHYEDGKLVFMTLVPLDTELLAETY